MEEMKYVLQILTVCQGVWVTTLMGFLMWHYIFKSMKNRYLEKNALAMGVSYCCLTAGTMISSLHGMYEWNDVWQITVIIGYAFGDYAIVKMLTHVTRNKKTTKVLRKYIDEELKKPKS